MAKGEEVKTLVVHLRGGQTIELRVTDCSVEKSRDDADLLSLRWEFADEKTSMPYLRADSIDAVIVRDE